VSLVVEEENEFGLIKCLRFCVQIDCVQSIRYSPLCSWSFAGADMSLEYLIKGGLEQVLVLRM